MTSYFAAPAERRDVLRPETDNPLTVSALLAGPEGSAVTLSWRGRDGRTAAGRVPGVLSSGHGHDPSPVLAFSVRSGATQLSRVPPPKALPPLSAPKAFLGE